MTTTTTPAILTVVSAAACPHTDTAHVETSPLAGKQDTLTPSTLIGATDPRNPPNPMPITRHGYTTNPKRNGSTRHYRTQRTIALANATHCAICGHPFQPDDTIEADHRTPRSAGGTDHHSNLQPAHKHCNNRKGGV